MDRKSFPKVAFKTALCAWLAGSALLFSASASSQVASLGFPQPPERITLDGNNVDVASGAISLRFDELSIGAEPYGLSLVSAYNSSSGWSDSLAGVLEVRTFGEWNGDIAISASWGNQGWVFNSNEGYARGGDGAYLTYNLADQFLVTLRDGTLITYSHLTASGELGCPNDGSMDCYTFYFATSIEYPNGLIVTPHYRVFLGSLGRWAVRVQSVTNNAGYQIKFNYQSNSVTETTRGFFLTRTSAVALNNAVQYCDPDADTCSLSGSWPTAIYASSSGTHTRTDPRGYNTVFTYSSTSFHVRTPANATDNIQYTLAPFIMGQSTVWRATAANLGAGTWSYGYVLDNQVNPTRLTTTSTDPLTKSTVYVASKYTNPTNFFGVWNAWPITSVKDPLLRTTSFSYPCAGGVEYVYFNTSTYQATWPELNSITPVCDGRGNIKTKTAQPKPNSGLQNLSTSATFPADCPNRKTCNRPSAMFDAKNARTDYEYSPTHGGITKETLPEVEVCDSAGSCHLVRPEKRYGYAQFSAYVQNASGALVAALGQVWLPTRVSECRSSASTPPPASTACANGASDEVVTTYEYGGAGSSNRLLVRGKVVTSNGVSLRTCYSYDNVGNQISVTTPRAGLSACPDLPAAGAAFTTWYRYNATRQLVGTIRAPVPGGYEAVRNTVDPDGRVTTVERGYLTQWQSAPPINWVNFNVLEVSDKTYDVLGRVTTSKRSSGTGGNPVLTQYGYDGAGRLECAAVRMNPAAYASLPAACELSTVGPDGQPDRITHFVYDVAGQMTVEQRAYKVPLLQQNYATYDYTDNGRRKWVEDANGNRSQYTYDGFDRLHLLNFPTSIVGQHTFNPNDYEQYDHDENGNRVGLRLRSNESIGYSYDALNRLTSKNLPTGSNVAYRYDLQGHNTIARFGSTAGLGVLNVFDGFGRLTSSTSASSSGSLQLSYLYDEDGNRTRVTWPDTNYVQYTYDGLDRMDQVRENGQSSSPGLLADYGYDMLSRRSNIARGNGTTTTFYPDGISRLDHLVQDLASTADDVTFGFSYNQASQITQRTVSNDSYSYFSLPQSRTYTPTGLNRYSAVAGVTYGYDGRGNLISDGSRSFNYDYENRLLSVSGSSSLSLTYDPMGRLQTTTGSEGTTRYLYDGDELVAEYDGGTLKRRYVHGAEVDEALVWYEGAQLNDRRWLHTDHHGSVVASSDGAGLGTVYAYGAYGEPAYDNWGGSRFRYTGQIALPEAKLYHYKARVYDPQLGRFLQTDPVGYTDDLNLYAYVGNDPMDRTDPTGENWNDFMTGVEDGNAEAMGAEFNGQPIQSGRGGDRGSSDYTLGHRIGEALAYAGNADRGGRMGYTPSNVRSANSQKPAPTADANRAASRAKGIPDSQIGPSGKPKVHTVEHPTTKSAKEAAQREVPEGGKVRFDAHPQDGQKPHYQAEDAKGENVKPVVHHCPPDKRC